MFTAAFTRNDPRPSKRWKNPNVRQLMNELNKMWYFHLMGNYLAIKINEVLRHVTTWMNLETILNERRKWKEKGK